MHFAHLPAGYITSKILFRRFHKTPEGYKLFMFCGMAGAIAPDFDILYDFLFDNSQGNHHEYFTHIPAFWLSLLLISLLWLLLDKNSSPGPSSAVVFTLGGFIHMILDTCTGPIFWLAPFSYTSYSWHSPNEYPWDVAYFVSWAFILELFIIWWAIFLFMKKKASSL